MMDILGIDAETIPNQSLPGNCVPQFDPETVKYGNTKDPEKRSIKLKAEEDKFNGSLDKKMSLDPAYLQVCTFVGILYNTDNSEVIDKTSIQITKDDENDFEAVHEAWKSITRWQNAKVPLVSFNGIAFDIPALFFRAMALDIPVPPHIHQKLKVRYDNIAHYDMMQILSFWDRQRWHSLDFYANLFGFSGKEGMDGSKVYTAWKEGQYDEIQKYCEQDVMITCKLFERNEAWIKVGRGDTEQPLQDSNETSNEIPEWELKEK